MEKPFPLPLQPGGTAPPEGGRLARISSAVGRAATSQFLFHSSPVFTHCCTQCRRYLCVSFCSSWSGSPDCGFMLSNRRFSHLCSAGGNCGPALAGPLPAKPPTLPAMPPLQPAMPPLHHAAPPWPLQPDMPPIILCPARVMPPLWPCCNPGVAPLFKPFRGKPFRVRPLDPRVPGVLGLLKWFHARGVAPTAPLALTDVPVIEFPAGSDASCIEASCCSLSVPAPLPTAPEHMASCPPPNPATIGLLVGLMMPGTVPKPGRMPMPCAPSRGRK
mmetsp:Transcript_20391/g.58069  ORF Transcript_20391/g.58069 Transcript_20391/m.58069 type:complete len:274 (-) Transcript_20391:349-1170(-)